MNALAYLLIFSYKNYKLNFIIEAPMPSVDLSPGTFSRLQAYAGPLGTIETVISRLLDSYEANPGAPTIPAVIAVSDFRTAIRDFSPLAPPELKHSKVRQVILAGKELRHAETNWNRLLAATICEAMARIKNVNEVRRQIIVKSVAGRKEGEGYRYLTDVGLSVQGQDANAAWRAALHLAKHIGCDLCVVFTWPENPDLAYPGVTGRLNFPGK